MTVLRCARRDTASRSRCTPRCTRSSTSPACPRRSRSRFKAWTNGGFQALHPNIEQKAKKSEKGMRALRDVSQDREDPMPLPSPRRRSKEKGRRGSRFDERREQQRLEIERVHGSGSGSGGESGSENGGTPRSPALECGGSGSNGTRELERGWHARRRDPRVNGADIYVARFTKNGMGSARPCWRCLEWCKWAGVKRIFHWNDEERRFDVVKVNSAQLDMYETHADHRLFAGLGW